MECEKAGLNTDFYMKTHHSTNYWSKRQPGQNKDVIDNYNIDNYWDKDPDKTFLGLRSTISAQAPIGQYLHRAMFDLLVAKYGNGIAITQIDLDPQKTNIHTTWAFDPGTLEELRKIFEDQWSKRKKSLIDRWAYLFERTQSGRPQDFKLPSGLQLIDRERPPLD